MRGKTGVGESQKGEINAILQSWLERGENVAPLGNTATESRPLSDPIERDAQPYGRFDFDLAEFPLFSFYKNRQSEPTRDPLIYTDTIKGQNGEPITRTWKVYPGAFGFGGATTQLLLYDLLQLYCEQGARGTRIEFGTVRSLLTRRGERHPSAKDYDRVRRDIDILRGYDFHAKNAFYDRRRQAYIDMKWRLFGSVFYFKPHPDDTDQELPFGFLEVSPVLQQIAQTRGFFSIGFRNELFYSLKPMEQRLAVYLAKKFVSQKLHRRFVEDLIQALPIRTATEIDARKALKQAAQGLLDKQVPIIAGFRFEKSLNGKWLAVFERKQAPRQDRDLYVQPAHEMPPRLRQQIDRIIEAVGSSDDRPWWTQCAKRLGEGAIDRALGLLKEARQSQTINNPGGMLTWYFQKIAKEQGVSLN